MKQFSKKAYLEIINKALASDYVISNFKNYHKNLEKNKIILLLRHDCDLSLDYALELAQIENLKNISSTYFILLYNDFYNPFSPSGKKKVREIYSLGHEIGIHWDSRNYEKNIKNKFTRDILLLEDVIGDRIISGSQHEPVQSQKMFVPSVIKYEAYRDFRDIAYVSDSSMRWRNITPWDLIQQKSTFQFLAHPFWWISDGKTRGSKFKNFLINEKTLKQKAIEEYAIRTEEFLKKRIELDSKFSSK